MPTAFEKFLVETWVEQPLVEDDSTATRERTRYLAAAEWFFAKYPPPEGRGAWLLVCTPDGRHEWIMVGGNHFVIGRKTACSLRLNSCFTSAEHCCIDFDGEDWLLKDMDSKNGLAVNGKPVREAYLKAGDTIEIGGISLLFHCRT